MEQLSDEQIRKEMQKQRIPEQFYAEGIDIVRNRIQAKTNCTLEEAVFFLMKWIKRLE